MPSPRSRKRSTEILRLPLAGNRDSTTSFFASSGHGEWPGVVIFGNREGVFFVRLQSSPPITDPTKGTHCAELQRCAKATPELYFQQRMWDLYWD
ncbi:hypothetical protein PoB_006529000 [Plakobranchus ocellatus]|uniref:Uncharacterized protein n=1 Tax=Plakobranchus ocellatus TaxID=259542 RepID=A0AAV4D3R9_9GAST|nr:hypothetical protein PoB_006529000 [Plakobranchus ocellatus]